MRACSSFLLYYLAGALCLLAAEDDVITKSKQAIASGNYSEAAHLLENLPAKPAQCETSFLLGLARYRLKQLDPSIVELQSAVECDLKNADYRVALAEAYVEKGDDNRALAALVAALKLQPDNRAALRDASSLYLRHEMNAEAIQTLNDLAKLEPKNSDVWTDLGAAYAGTVNFAKAEASFEAALRLNPRNASALVGLGHVAIKTEQPERAIKLLTEAIQTAPNAYEPRFLRGTAFNKVGRNADALTDLQAAVRLGGQDPEIYYRLAQVYKALGRADESKQALTKFSTLRSQSDAAEEDRRKAAELALQANQLVKERRLNDAIAALEKSRELAGPSPQTLFRLAGLYYDTQQYDLALQDVRQAIELAPSEWTYQYLLGLVQRSTDNPSGAKESFETALRLNPSAAEVFNQLGELAAARGDTQDALKNFDQATRLNANEPSYEANLQRIKALVPHR